MHDYIYWAVAFLLSWGAISTYWDWLFGYDNFYAHGFGIGLAMFPLTGIGVEWWLIVARSLLLAIAMGVWSRFVTLDYKQEMGRGALIILTLPILFF